MLYCYHNNVLLISKGGSSTMEKKKCDYCGEYYDEKYEGTLDNGCPACPKCVAEEEAEETEGDGNG